MNYQGETYLDKLSISTNRIYEILETDKSQISTTQVARKFIQDIYKMGVGLNKNVLGIHVSSGLSGVVRSSIMAGKELSNSDNKIEVIDSLNASCGQGLVVLRAAEAIRQGMSFEELSLKAKEWAKNCSVYVGLGTLKFVIRSGRISPLKGVVARVLNVKPVITLNEKGKGDFCGKAFSRKANFKKILRLAKEELQKGPIWGYAISHTGSPYLDDLCEFMEKETGILPRFISETTPAIGLHAGPKAICVSILRD